MKCFISRSFRADPGHNQKNISIDHDLLPDSIIFESVQFDELNLRHIFIIFAYFTEYVDASL